MIFSCKLNQTGAEVEIKTGTPILFKKIEIPDILLKEGNNYSGDIRMGELTGNGSVDFLVYGPVDDTHDGGVLKTCS